MKMIPYPNILLIYTEMIPSVHLCGHVQLEFLQEKGYASIREVKHGSVCRDDIVWADVVLFVRSDSYEEEWLMRQCRKSGKYTIYILDDDLLNVPHYISSASYYSSRETRNRIKHLLTLCHALASPSPVLLEKYGNNKPQIRIIEPSLAKTCMEKSSRESGKVYIGFAGSIDRGKDIDDLLCGALQNVSKKYPEKVVIEIMGPETEISHMIGATTYPYLKSYNDYQIFMAELNWDIGIAPMPDTSFHRCKHYNKLVEYAGFGIAGVYSNLSPYNEAVENGVTGLLCDNTEQAWTAALMHLVEDDILRKQISKNCLTLASKEFSIEHSAQSLLQQIIPLLPMHKGEKKLPFFEFERALSQFYTFVVRCINVIRQRKVRSTIREKISGRPGTQ